MIKKINAFQFRQMPHIEDGVMNANLQKDKPY